MYKVRGKGRLLVSGLWHKIGNFTYGMVNTQGKIAMDGDFRSHKAGCRPAPPRPPLNIYPIPLVKSDLKTSPETRSRPLPLTLYILTPPSIPSVKAELLLPKQ